MKSRIIFLHTIVQLILLMIFEKLEGVIRTSYSIDEFITSMENPNPPSFMEKYEETIIIGLALILFIFSFIILGVLINKIYRPWLTYWKYLFTGTITSIIALCIFYLVIKFEENRPTYDTSGLNSYFSSVLQHIYIIPLYSIFLILVCGVTAFFYTKFKR